MIRNFILIISFAYTFILPAQSVIDIHFDEVRKLYSGQRAWETTAYVEQFFRLPGNNGFDSSIYHVQKILELAGFKSEAEYPESRMTYRIERIPMDFNAWEPVEGSLQIVGEEQPLLELSTNRNMICINSNSTPSRGVRAELVYIGLDTDWEKIDLEGKIVMADDIVGSLFYSAVLQEKALGVLAYSIPTYNQPQKHVHSIPFRSVPQIKNNPGWAINLSYHAREQLLKALDSGKVELDVNVQTHSFPSTELALVANIKGSIKPKERFVFSAHVQEPGANDNASGVGCLAEMARIMAHMVTEGTTDPKRSITFLWGDEIKMTRRYIQQDEKRKEGILWGMSLDMVGEDTDKTGGVFLIEKMPDPSAIWTRGDDKHTEWGATEISKSELIPHYFNDFIQYVCEKQGDFANWKVSSNPYEGGSDHQPFLDAEIPGILLWHFTDVFYHTDADRIDKVSKETLKNVGISASVSALSMCSGDELLPDIVLQLTRDVALERLKKEFEISFLLLSENPNADLAEQLDIITTWSNWYNKSLATIYDLSLDGITDLLKERVLQSQIDIDTQTALYIQELRKL